jgi:hypothetical protein
VSITEDNQVLAKQIADNESWLKGLMQLREHGGPRAVASCAVLHNIFAALEWFDHNTPMDGASDAMLVPALVQCMNQAEGQDSYSNGSSHSSPDKVLQMALEITASIATSLQEALEHAGKHEEEFEGFEDKADGDGDGDDTMMTDDINDDESEDGGEREDEGEESGSEDEITQEEMEADMNLVTGIDHGSDDDTDGVQPTLDSLIRLAAPYILKLITTTTDAAIKDNAISALNNIAWTISSIDFTDSNSHLYNLWAPLAQEIWSKAISPVLASNTADIELAASITSLAWAIARSVSGKISLAPGEHQKFMALYQASKILDDGDSAEGSDAFQGLGVKCIGVLGRLALDPAPLALNREVGVFLLTVLAALPDAKTADVVEVLNQIFDIYADKAFACDEVFWNNNFYKHLEELKPKVAKAAKVVDKRKETELRLRADEAVLNLGRFLAYKRKERK